MKLIILYGAPASGKYTIGKLLSDKTGLKFFHNHVTIDLLRPLFTFGTPEFFNLSDTIRLDIFEEAARQGIPGMIFTFVYDKSADDTFIKNIVERVTKYGGEVKFIQIYCDKEELLKRVGQEDRHQAKKLTSSDKLVKMIDKGVYQTTIPNVDSTLIDTTNLTANEALAKVLEII